MSDRSPNDFSKYIPSITFVRLNAIRDQESGRSRMVGNNSQGSIRATIGSDFRSCQLGSALDKRLEKIGVVVGDDALEDGGDALEAQAGIHGGFGKLFQS